MSVDGDITAALNKVSAVLRTSVRSAMKDAAAVCRAELKQTARYVPGADRRFSRGAGMLGVKTRYSDDGVTISPTGAWGIAEEGARPHAMPAWGRGTANHPGTRSKQGKHSWSKGRDQALTRLERDLPESISD